jgi:uncharacterized protein YbaR (Trm112 family)
VSAPHVGHPNLVAPNRFSDAELAAEYWKQADDMWDGRVILLGESWHAREQARRDTILRFATFPHFDEAPGWDAMSGFAPLRGVLHCPACGRFARVVDGLPDCVRHGVQEVAFT